MPTTTLPFTKEKKIEATSLYQMLPQVLQDVTRDNPHLLSYLQTVPIDEVGIPQYHLKLNRKLDELKQPNIIYPTSALGNFVHIYFDPTDE
jgi:flagellar protein FlaI